MLYYIKTLIDEYYDLDEFPEGNIKRELMKVKAKMIKDEEDGSGCESEESVMSGEEIKLKGKTSNQFNFKITK